MLLGCGLGTVIGMWSRHCVIGMWARHCYWDVV